MPDLMDLEFEEFEELDIFEDKKDDFPITEEQLQCVDVSQFWIVQNSSLLQLFIIICAIG